MTQRLSPLLAVQVASLPAASSAYKGATMLQTSDNLLYWCDGTIWINIGAGSSGNLTGDVTSVGLATTLTNAPVIAKVLTGYVSGAGTISATDSILSAIQKLNGNDATNANLTGVVTSVGNATSIAAGAISNAMLANGAVANLSGTNTGDNSANSTYASDYRAANFIAGTNYLAPPSGTSLLKANSSGALANAVANTDYAPAVTTTLGDIVYGGASGVATRLAGNITTNQLYLTQTGDGVNSSAPSWQIMPVMSAASYYLQNTVSDVSGYLKQLTTPYGSLANFSTSVGTGTTLIKNWITDPGLPGVTFLPPGQYYLDIHAAQTEGTKQIYLYAEIWETNAAGVDIAKICTLGNTSFLTGIDAENPISGSLGAQYIFTSNASRVCTRVYAVGGGTGSAATVVAYMGLTDDSRIQTPRTVVDATTFVPYIGATVNLNLGSKNLTTTGVLSTGHFTVEGVTSTGSTGTGSIVFASSPTLVTPNLGTPSSLVGTNITGTATAFTASNVTTNANLTGDVTSVGNASTVVKINGTSLAGLATGLLKNTTGTGVPSIAVANTDYTPAVMTNVGDLIYGGVSGAASRLAIGGANTVLHGDTNSPTYSAVVEADITLSANTTNNVSISRHGFCPVLPNNAAQFLNGQGNYTTPAGLTISASYLLTSFSGQTSVTVTHNFGTYPIVQLIDNATPKAVFVPLNIKHNSLNDFTVTFTASSSGSIIASVGSPQPQALTTVAAGTYTTLTSDRIISVTTSGAIITLLTAVGNTGREFNIDNASSGNITVNTTSSQTINGQLSQLVPPNSAMTVYSNGSAWRII